MKPALVAGLLLLTGCTTGGGTLRAGSVEREPVASPEAPAASGAATRSDPGGGAELPSQPRNAGAVSLQGQAAAGNVVPMKQVAEDVALAERGLAAPPDQMQVSGMGPTG